MPLDVVIAEAIKGLIALAVQMANRAGAERAELDAIYEAEKNKGLQNDPADLPSV